MNQNLMKKGSPLYVSPDEVSGIKQHIQSPDRKAPASQSNEEASSLPMVALKDNLLHRQSANCSIHVSQSNQEESGLRMIPKKESYNFQQNQGLDSGIQTLESNEEESCLSMISKKESDSLQQRQSPDGGIHTSRSNQKRSPLSVIPEKMSEILEPRQSPDTGIYAAESNTEGKVLSVIHAKVPDRQGQGPYSGVTASQSDQENFSLSIRSEKMLDKLTPRRNLDTGVPVLQQNREGRHTSGIPEKASEDGYNWRKYGQKLVKGNDFVRSYYKCTYPNCPAKKQVERSHDGLIADINYLGKHEHPKPQHSPQIATVFALPIQAKVPDEPSFTVAKDESSNAPGETSYHVKPTKSPHFPSVAASNDVVEGEVSQSTEPRDCDPDLKRQKRNISNIDDNMVHKSNGESRLVVQTMSEVDVVNDGYRWRKYGQKMVKGNPNPRSYYRCSNAGCPVKKHVERASYDSKVVITTYEGQHDHDMPPVRTVTHNTTGTSTNITAVNGGDSISKPEENEAVGAE